MKNVTLLNYVKSLIGSAAVVAAFFASTHCAHALGLGATLDCSFTGASGDGITISGGSGDCWQGTYMAENGGGTITLQVDLPCGTFDISATPGPYVGGNQGTPDVTDGTSSISPTGIVGPATVYVNFLNAGAAITTAESLSVDGEPAEITPAELDVPLDCSFTGASGDGITVSGGSGDCWQGTYMAENGGGTITLQVDLPCGTFDISATPGPYVGGLQGTPDVTDGTSSISPTGIVGPTTVYVNFLNAGAAITTAESLTVYKY